MKGKIITLGMNDKKKEEEIMRKKGKEIMTRERKRKKL